MGLTQKMQAQAPGGPTSTSGPAASKPRCHSQCAGPCHQSICSSKAAHLKPSYTLLFHLSQSPQGCQRTSKAPETNQCLALLPKTIDKVSAAVTACQVAKPHRALPPSHQHGDPLPNEESREILQ